MAHPLAVFPARISPSAKVRIQIAAGVSSPLARRDRGLSSLAPGLIQFRSAAVGAASLIVGALRAIGARVQRVFASMKEVVLSLVHASKDRIGAKHGREILTQEHGNV